VQIVVYDGGGRGVAAAQVAGVALAALRNARRVGAPLADQAQLADQALFSHYGGKHYLPTVLLEVDLETLRLDVVDAGSPRVLHLPAGSASASPTVLNLDPQMPLGMFEDTPYEVQSFSLQRGDRLVVLTDGVTEPAPRGEAFVDAALGVALRGARLLPAAEAVRWVLRALGDHLDETDPDDDAAVLCLDLPAV
jgi:serine phosphatase RsbU (regulator of sigma subunit)